MMVRRSWFLSEKDIDLLLVAMIVLDIAISAPFTETGSSDPGTVYIFHSSSNRLLTDEPQQVCSYMYAQWCRQGGACGLICTQSMHLCTHPLHDCVVYL